MRKPAQPNPETQSWPTRKLRLHPKAALVPEMSPTEAAALEADIEERDILVPIEITKSGVVLDGRQRLRTARQIGLETVPVRIVEPRQDAVEYMLAAALQRRHLSPSQRAVLALELHDYKQQRATSGARKKTNLRNSGVDVAALPHRGRSRELAAHLAGVSPRLIQNAIAVRENSAKLLDQVKAGEVTLQRAPADLQRRKNHAQIGPSLPLPDGRFELIYGDPPWQLGNPGSRWSPEQHYQTEPTKQIKALAVPAADDAVLFLWAVSSRLPDALEVISAWGFTYKTSIVWVKPSIGLGAWVRHRHELLLVAQRGNYPAPKAELRPDSVLEARRGRHSEKPKQVYELIERMYPNASKLELYARGRPRPGWTAWGNQLEQQAAA